MKQQLPFTAFLARVGQARDAGTVTADEALAVQALMKRYDPTKRDQFRDALASILAHDRNEAIEVRRLFDETYPRGPGVPPWPPAWLLASSVLSILIALTLGGLWLLDHSRRVDPTTTDAAADASPDASDVGVEGEAGGAETSVPPAIPSDWRTPPKSCEPYLAGAEGPRVASLSLSALTAAPIALIAGLVLLLRARRRRDAPSPVAIETEGETDYRVIIDTIPVERQDEAAIETLARTLERSAGRTTATRELDVRRTVDRFARTLRIEPVMKTRSSFERLLVLRDTADAMSAWRWRVDGFLDDLRRRGVSIDVLYFHGDPSFASREPLGELRPVLDWANSEQRYPLIVLTAAKEIPQDWTKALAPWPVRVVLDPSGLQRRERPALPVFSLDRRGLEDAVAGLRRARRKRAPQGAARPSRRDIAVLRAMMSFYPQWDWSLAEQLRRKFLPRSSPAILAAAYMQAPLDAVGEPRRVLRGVFREEPAMRVRFIEEHARSSKASTAGSLAELRLIRDRALLQLETSTRAEDVDSDALRADVRRLAATPFRDELRSALERTGERIGKAADPKPESLRSPVDVLLESVRAESSPPPPPPPRLRTWLIPGLASVLSWALVTVVVCALGWVKQDLPLDGSRVTLLRERDRWTALCVFTAFSDIDGSDAAAVHLLAFASRSQAHEFPPKSRPFFVTLDRGRLTTFSAQPVRPADVYQTDAAAFTRSGGRTRVFLTYAKPESVTGVAGVEVMKPGGEETVLFDDKPWGAFPRYENETVVHYSTSAKRFVRRSVEAEFAEPELAKFEHAKWLLEHGRGFMALVASASGEVGTDVDRDSVLERLVRGRPGDWQTTPRPSCEAGNLRCAGLCRDVTTDPVNCGACGNQCAIGEVCANGVCTCTPPRMRCGDACVDPTTDRSHCGVCDKACDDLEWCNYGRCEQRVCTPPKINCQGYCVDPRTDMANCGKCGNACSTGIAIETCSNAVCTFAGCRNWYTACGRECVVLSTDPRHCGACGVACKPLPHRAAVCVGGICGSGACEPGWGDCDENYEKIPNGCETSLNTPENCGACGQKCGQFFVCSKGKCTCPDYRVECPGSSKTEAAVCTDVLSDAKNCGGCGQQCGDKQTCFEGKCASAGCIGACSNAYSACVTEKCGGDKECAQYCAKERKDCQSKCFPKTGDAPKP